MSNANGSIPDRRELLRRIEVAVTAARLAARRQEKLMVAQRDMRPLVLWRMFILCIHVICAMTDKFNMSDEDVKEMFAMAQAAERFVRE